MAAMKLTTEAGRAEQAFDLNIEKVLEHWAVPFAIRELIANAKRRQPQVIGQFGMGLKDAPSAGPDRFASSLARPAPGC
jgi:hypothetical protein